MNRDCLVFVVVSFDDILDFAGSEKRDTGGQNMLTQPQLNEFLAFVVGYRTTKHARISFVERTSEEAQVVAHFRTNAVVFAIFLDLEAYGLVTIRAKGHFDNEPALLINSNFYSVE